MSPYLRLMRLHQPTGIWLLLWPCWWSLALTSAALSTYILFALGAVLMRSAGCIINDIADRKLDKEVERTRMRPLASGELSLMQAIGLLALLLTAAFGVAFILGQAVMLWAALSLLPVSVYPLMKRISWWPQLFLGFTFNWGALMGWAAMRGNIEWPAIILYIGCIFWTLGYDTIYAHQDKKDDARIGIKSTALRLGSNTKRAVAVFYLLALIGWMAAAGGTLAGYGILLVSGVHLAWQVKSVNLENPDSCRRVFISNRSLGALVFLGFLLSH